MPLDELRPTGAVTAMGRRPPASASRNDALASDGHDAGGRGTLIGGAKVVEAGSPSDQDTDNLTMRFAP